MYVKRVVLENIRPFERLDFSFDRGGRSGAKEGTFAGWSVITGDNASGKSTLLRAIALALLGPDQTRGLGEPLTGWVRRGATTGTIAVEILASDVDRFAGGGQRPKDSFWAELRLDEVEGEVILKPGETYRGKRKGAGNGPWRPGTEKWFSVGYGPFRRLRGSSSEAARQMAQPGRTPRFGTMFKEDATLAESVQWLRDLKFRALEGGSDAQAVMQAVERFLDAEFLRNDLHIDTIDSHGLWLKDGAGIRHRLDDMSDGYRAALAMLTDLLRQVVTVYGPEGLLLDRGDGRLVIPHAGVVLVDEIDAHLHPEWQRTIGFWLKERFPAVQFLVTSHSPFVCQASDPGGLFYLPLPAGGGKPQQIAEEVRLRIIASKSDTILLSPAFGLEETRSPLAVASRREYATLKAKRLAGQATPADLERSAQLQLFVPADD